MVRGGREGGKTAGPLLEVEKRVEEESGLRFEGG